MSGSERPALSDEAIRAMLVDRAERAGPFGIDVPTVIAAAGPRASRRWFGVGRAERLSVGATAAAAVIVAAVLIAGPLATPPAGTTAPASAPTSSGPIASLRSPSPSVLVLPEVRTLTAAEFGDLARARSTTLPPIPVAVAGTLEADPTVRCRASVCATVLVGSGGIHVTPAGDVGPIRVTPVGDVGPGPWDGSGPTTGTFALRTPTAVTAGVRLAEYIGTLTVPRTGGPAWFVQDIREGAVSAEGAYAAVRGWLVRDPFHPCASNPRPPAVSYGCPTDDWLSESEFQPLQADGSSIGPPAAIYLSSGSYDQWAPDPAPFGRDNVGVVPRYGIFLMWLVSDGCGPNADCAPALPRWRIVGRFDPIVAPVADPGPNPSPSPATAEHPTASGVWTVAQLMDERPPSTIDYVVDGWLEAVFEGDLRCAAPRPIPSGWPRHDCGRADWLTDAPFRPKPLFATPDVGILVESGAYDAFAPDPTWAEQLAVPRAGRYVVRVALHSSCEAGFPSPGVTCLGGPVWTWEIVGTAPN
jgi:hypothetical protein